MNFLVVDDNRLLNRFLTTYLRGKGHVASSLTDSSKVESWLDLNPCDGLILDIDRPTSGSIREPQAAMEDLVEFIRTSPPAAFGTEVAAPTPP